MPNPPKNRMDRLQEAGLKALETQIRMVRAVLAKVVVASGKSNQWSCLMNLQA